MTRHNASSRTTYSALERRRKRNSCTMQLGTEEYVLDMLYRARNKGMHILLSNSQARSGRTVKQEQEEISRNHVQAFIPGSVYYIQAYAEKRSCFVKHQPGATRQNFLTTQRPFFRSPLYYKYGYFLQLQYLRPSACEAFLSLLSPTHGAPDYITRHGFIKIPAWHLNNSL